MIPGLQSVIVQLYMMTSHETIECYILGKYLKSAYQYMYCELHAHVKFL